MEAILAICEDHGHPPSWWDTLTADDQALLLGRRNARIKREARARKAEERRARNRR